MCNRIGGFKPMLPVFGGVQRNCGNGNTSVFGNGNQVGSPKIIVNNGTMVNGNGNRVGNNCIGNDRFCGGQNQNRMFAMMSGMMNAFMQMMQQMLQVGGCGQELYNGCGLGQYPDFQTWC